MNDFDKNNKIRRKKVSSVNYAPFEETQGYKKIEQNINLKETEKVQINKKREINNRKNKKVRINKGRLIKSILAIFLVFAFIVSVPLTVLVFAGIKDSGILTKEKLEAKYISNEVVSSEEIPQYLKDAVVSIEDERFYKHKGVDVISLARSVLHNLLSDTTQGGSTLEMQLSKNLITNTDKTMKRKIKDIYNALQMNKIMSKDEILTAYLNNIYLGKSSYGVGKGAKAYFGKEVSQLNLAECAMLAGITNNPSRYQEFREAKNRQETILYKMKQLGYIGEEEYKEALSEEVRFKSEIE